MRLAIILRGLPGSGKTLFAKTLQDFLSYKEGSRATIFSLDDLRTVDGVYTYDPDNSKELANKLWGMLEAHVLSKNMYTQIIDIVIIDNTCRRLWEMDRPIEILKAHKYLIHIIEVQRDTDTCKSSNVHDIHGATIDYMHAQWERFK